MSFSTLRAAIRAIEKSRLVSTINIGGLALGLMACLLIYAVLQHELSIDHWAGKAENIFRVEAQYDFDGVGYMEEIMAPLRPEIEAKVPEISQSTRVKYMYWTMQRDDALFYEVISLVDESFFDIFPLELLSGDRSRLLGDLNSIVLSETQALKYFGRTSVVDEVLRVDGGREFRVTGVFRNPGESHMALDAMVLWNDDYSPQFGNWSSTTAQIYVRLDEAGSKDIVEASLRSFVAEHKPFMRDDEEDPNSKYRFFLQPFRDIALISQGRTGQNPYGNLANLWGFGAIAGLILIIACANYINLTTARAFARTREVCIRKVAGARRRDLVRQFMSETIILALVSLILALLAAKAALPWLSELMGSELQLDLGNDWQLWILGLSLVGLVGVIAGLYPSLYVTRFHPAAFLNTSQSSSAGSPRFRTALVWLQFTIAITLIISASVIAAQMRYTVELDTGISNDDFIILRNINDNSTRERADSLKVQLARIPGVTGVTRSHNVPGDGTTINLNALARMLPPDDAPSLHIMPGDYEFLETYKIGLVAGRYLNEAYSTDSLVSEDNVNPESASAANAVVNELAVRKLGFESADEILGERVRMSLAHLGGEADFTIVGVVRDVQWYNFFRDKVDFLYYRHSGGLNAMSVRVADGQLAEVLEKVEHVWRTLYPDVPITRQILREKMEIPYRLENRRMEMLIALATLAVFLSCMGLFGLGMFSAEARVKEIGIRKVLGAQARQIVWLFVRQFSKPVILANLIAWPLAWYYADQWLAEFSVRIDLSPSYFIGASLLVLAIGGGSVGGYALKAARTNPIVALRRE